MLGGNRLGAAIAWIVLGAKESVVEVSGSTVEGITTVRAPEQDKNI